MAYLEEARAIAEEAQIAQALQYVYFDLAITSLAIGRYDDAFDAVRKNVALSERVGDQGFWWCRAKNTLGRIYVELGDFDRGELHNLEAIERALVFGDLETLRNAQLNVADCALGRGDAAGARDMLEELQREFDADTDPGEWMKWRYTMHLWMSMSQALLAAGDPDRALDLADRCIEQAEATRVKRYVSKGQRARGLALAALGRADEALTSIDVAIAVAEEMGGPEPIWQALAARAAVLAGADRDAEALDAAGRALAVIDGIVAGLREPGVGESLLGSPDVHRLRELAAG